MWEGGGYHPFGLPQLYSVQANSSQLQGVSSSIQLLHIPTEVITVPPLHPVFSLMITLVIWGIFQHLSRSFQLRQERERETFRQNWLSGDTNLFIFSSTKALKTFNLYSLSEDICLSVNHCVNARAENESVGQLPNC